MRYLTLALILHTLIALLLGDTLQMATFEDGDDTGLDLGDKPRHLGTHSLYGSLKRSRRSHSDMIVMFYHPQCPHCHLFLPKFYQIVNTLKKEKLALKFYLGDCGLHPQYLSAFSITGFPFLIYFHNGLPMESMPPQLTMATPLTE